MPRRLRLAPALAALTVTAAWPGPAEAGAAVGPVAPARARTGRAIAQYVRARLADAAGDHAAALEALRLALVADPDSVQLRISYADVLARTGERDRAEGEARRAVELAAGGAEAADAHLALGRLLALSVSPHAVRDAARELQAAADLEAERVRGRAPEEGDGLDPEPWRALTRLRLDAGDGAGAAATAERLAELDRVEGGAALREVGGRLLDLKAYGSAAAALRRSVELAPAEGGAWKLLADAEEALERPAEARKAWERAIAIDPDDADALLAAGQLAQRQGDLAAARALLKQVVRAASDEVTARVRVAAAWLDARQPADALETCAGTDDPRLTYLRGVALQQLRRWDEAAAAFARVKPSSGDLYGAARVSLAHALARAGRPQEAVRAVRRGLEASPHDPALLFALGEAYDSAGQRDAALDQMRALLALRPDHAEALNFLGYAYAERGERLDEAQSLVERAVQLEPGNGYFLDSLGWVLYRRGDLDRALRALERADALVGPEPTILEHLGDAYRALHRPSEAAAAYGRALEAFEKGEGPAQTARAALESKLRELGRREAPATSTSRR